MKLSKCILLVFGLVCCFGITLVGCNQDVAYGAPISLDLQSQQNCLYAEYGDECFMIKNEGIFRYCTEASEADCIIKGVFSNISCNDKYIYCIEETPFNDAPELNKQTLVRIEIATKKKTLIAEHVDSYAFVGDEIVYQYEPNWFYVKDHKSLKKHYGSLFRIGLNGKGRKLLVDEHVDLFWAYDGLLWYGVSIPPSNENDRVMEFYKCDVANGKKVCIGSSVYSGFCASYNNLVFCAWPRENKLVIWDAMTFSESVLPVSYENWDNSLYVFPIRYAKAFDQKQIIYSSEDYCVIAIQKYVSSLEGEVLNSHRPYSCGDTIIWFGGDTDK